MICPGCSTALEPSEDLPVDGRIGVCPKCARSLVLEGDTLRFATSADLEHLNDGQIKELRKARPSEWRKAVLATKARIKGR